MLNKCYGRGVCSALQEIGLTKFANEDIAGEAADEVSDAVIPEEMPEEVAPEQTAALVDNLIQLSDALQESSEHAGAAADEAAKSASVKNAAAWLRKKLAEGSTITGQDPEQQNELENSVSAEARLDEMNRPGGAAYANVGVQGVGTQEASGEGAIGSEKEHPGSMGPVEKEDTNSAIEAVKGASVSELIRKLAQGTTIMPNTPTTPDANTGEGQLDDANRPGGAGYANKGVSGVGKSDMAAKLRAAAVGDEEKHPGTMGPVGQSGTNTAMQQVSGAKSAADASYIQNFKQVADKYAGYLPPRLDAVEKIAALQYMMGLEPIERDKLALHMQKTAEMPEGLAEYVEAKKDEGEEGEKKEEKKKKDKEEEKEASDVLARVRALVHGA